MYSLSKADVLFNFELVENVRETLTFDRHEFIRLSYLADRRRFHFQLNETSSGMELKY